MTTKHLLGAAVLLLAGCGFTVPEPVYRPHSLERFDARVDVQEFSYQPYNAVHQTELSGESPHVYTMTVPVGVYVRTAVVSELKSSNVTVDRKAECKLGAVITRFGLQDLGFSVTYDSRIRYTIRNTERQLFDRMIATTHTTRKELPAGVGLNELLRQGIDKLFQDTAFRTIMKSGCR